VDILGGSDTPVPRHGMACHLLPGTKSIALLGGYNGHEMVSNVDILDLDVEAILARRKAEKEAAALANFGALLVFCILYATICCRAICGRTNSATVRPHFIF